MLDLTGGWGRNPPPYLRKFDSCASAIPYAFRQVFSYPKFHIQFYYFLMNFPNFLMNFPKNYWYFLIKIIKISLPKYPFFPPLSHPKHGYEIQAQKSMSIFSWSRWISEFVFRTKLPFFSAFPYCNEVPIFNKTQSILLFN